MKKLLITGGSSLLGQYLNLTAESKFSIFTTFKNNLGNCGNFPSSKIDIFNRNSLQIIFKDVRWIKLVTQFLKLAKIAEEIETESKDL